MISKIDKQIGKNIKSQRKIRGLTQEELASAIKVNNRITIVNIEKGTQSISVTQLWLICCALNCDPSFLFPPVKKTKYVLRGMPNLRNTYKSTH